MKSSAKRPPSADNTPDAAELAFWDAIKDSQRPEELRAYLEQYPEGPFASLAQLRLADAEDGDRTSASSPAPVSDAVELAFWESIAESDDPKLFEAYLQKYPLGEFAVIAKARL